MIPFFVYYALAGARALDESLQRRWGRRHVATLAFLTVTLLTYVARYSTLPLGPIDSGVERPEGIELFSFVRQKTAPQDIILFSKPRVLALYTGRRASAPYYPSDPCALWTYLRQIGATYVVTGPTGPYMESEKLAAFVAHYPDSFREMMRNREFAVLRVVHDLCPTPPSSPRSR